MATPEAPTLTFEKEVTLPPGLSRLQAKCANTGKEDGIRQRNPSRTGQKQQRSKWQSPSRDQPRWGQLLRARN